MKVRVKTDYGMRLVLLEGGEELCVDEPAWLEGLDQELMLRGRMREEVVGHGHSRLVTDYWLEMPVAFTDYKARIDLEDGMDIWQPHFASNLEEQSDE